MSNPGQIALTVVGTAVGAFFGGPSGAMLGFSLGSTLGQLAFPTKPQQPSVQDARVMGASEGTPIPRVIGTYRIAGTVIWCGDFSQNTSGGKGGPKVPTTSYHVSFAVLLCAGPIVGVRRIWLDKTLVYDKSEHADNSIIAATEQFEQYLTVHVGSETQLPDATMEAHLGAGNVPAHRGTAYLVFNDLDVTAFGTRLPQVEVEVVQNGLQPTTSQLTRASDVLYDWVAGYDPRSCHNDHQYYGGAGWRDTLSQAAADWAAQPGTDFAIDTSLLATWHYDSDDRDTVFPANAGGSSLRTAEILQLHFLEAGFSFGSRCSDLGGPFPCAPARIGRGGGYHFIEGDIFVNPSAPIYNWTGLAGTRNTFGTPLVHMLLQTGTVPGTSGTATWDVQTVNQGTGGYPGDIFYGINQNSIIAGPRLGTWSLGSSVRFVTPRVGFIKCRRKPRGPDAPCFPRCDQQPPHLDGTTFCLIGGELVSETGYGKISSTTNDYAWLADYRVTSGVVQGYPYGPVLPVADPQNTQAYWDNAYAQALLAGTPMLPTGMTYGPRTTPDGLHYPILKTYDWERNVQATPIRPQPVTVADAITAIASWVGLTPGDLDVSQAPGSLWGMAVARASSARDALTPLMTYAGLMAAESGGKLRFVSRGSAPVATLTEDDLVEAGGNNGRAPITRAQDVDLPRAMRVHFANRDHDYQDGLTTAVRPVSTTVQVQDMDLPIAMTPTQAAQIADIWLRASWCGRETATISVPASWLPSLQAASALLLSLGGVARRYLIQSVDYAWPATLQLQIIRDEQNGWTSIEAASGSGSSAQSLAPTGPSELLPLDLPALRVQDDVPGYYAAIYPLYTPWPGATVFRSVDGGNNYDTLLSVSLAASAGTVSKEATDWPETQGDQTTILNVLLLSASLSTSTTPAVLNGANVAAYGVDGRWEIVQFVTAVHNGDGSYAVSGLLRGCLGTQRFAGQHVAGDSFVLLTGNIVHLNDSLGYLGTNEKIRTVTSGQALQSAGDFTFQPRFQGLRPLAPRALRGGRNSAGDLLLAWTRQDRFATDLLDGADVPMSEASELYDVEIYTDNTFATVKRLIASVSSAQATYTAAQQTSDFGAPQSAIAVRVYQISSRVGRGAAVSGTF